MKERTRSGPSASRRRVQRPQTASRDVLAGFALLGFGVAGAAYGFSTLPLAVGMILATLGFELAVRRPRVLRLLDIWRFAFVYLFGSEVIASLPDVRSDFGRPIAATAEGFIVAAFGASLIGYALGRFLVPMRQAHGATVLHRRGSPRIAALMLLSTFIVLYVAIGVSPGRLLAERAMRDSSVGPAFPMVATVMVVQCTLVARQLASTRFRAAYLFPIAVAIGSFGVLYLVGTRFFLGFFVSGVLFFATRFMEPLSARRLSLLCALAVVLILAQGTMRLVRGIGIEEAMSRRVASSLGQTGMYLSNEGMLRVHAWVHDKRVYADSDHAPEHAFLLYWWVPRSLWPSKPTMDGYWLAHEVMMDGDVGAGHSVAGGFALPALLDFGPRLGILVCLMYGLALWGLERFAARHRSPADAASVFSSLLPFAIFFVMRSPQTSMIFLESCLALYLPIFVLDRVASRGHRRLARMVSSRRPGRVIEVPRAAHVLRWRLAPKAIWATAGRKLA